MFTLYTITGSQHVEESTIEFHANEVQFRWIQFDSIGSPMWAIDEILIDCDSPGGANSYRSVSFEERPKYVRWFSTNIGSNV